MLMMLIPESWLSMERQWLIMFVLATPVQFWAGWQFYRGAWAALRHRTSDMNTLIAVGTSVAYLYSAAVTFFPGAFEAAAGAGFEAAVYYDSAVIIIGLILLGRYLEARAKGQTSAAMRRLIGLQAKTARVVREPASAGAAAHGGRRRGAGDRHPGGGGRGGRRGRRPARARRSRWTAWCSRAARRWTSPCSPASPSRWRRGRATRSSGRPSTAPARSASGRPRWDATPRWPRSCAWWRRPRAPRLPSSAWPTTSPASSCRWCWRSRWSPSWSGTSSGRSRRSPWPCWPSSRW